MLPKAIKKHRIPKRKIGCVWQALPHQLVASAPHFPCCQLGVREQLQGHANPHAECCSAARPEEAESTVAAPSQISKFLMLLDKGALHKIADNLARRKTTTL